MTKTYWPGRTLAQIYGDVEAEGPGDGHHDTAVTADAPQPTDQAIGPL